MSFLGCDILGDIPTLRSGISAGERIEAIFKPQFTFEEHFSHS
jgi:hypothetical protein